MPGMKREDPDYFPLLVGNYVLGGGGFDSRMLIEIRQKRGLAYSAYSYFSPMRELGPFQIGLQTKRESTDEALQVLRETLARFVSDGPTEDELAQAKNNLVGSFPLRLDSNKKILDHLAMIGFYRLPMDWLDTYTKRVEAVTRADVLRAFQARVRLGAMSTVIVGGQPTPPAK
jgi:zinc protease